MGTGRFDGFGEVGAGRLDGFGEGGGGGWMVLRGLVWEWMVFFLKELLAVNVIRIYTLEEEEEEDSRRRRQQK